MFDLSFTPAELQAFSFAFLFFVTGIAAFFILTTNYRNKTARYFALAALFGSLVNIFSFLYHTTESLELARNYRIISQFFAIPFIVELLFFAVTLYETYMPSRLFYRIIAHFLMAAEIVCVPFFMLDIFGAQYFIGAVTSSPSVQLSPLPGTYLSVYIALFVLGALFVTYLMTMLWRDGKTRDARVLGFLMLISAGIPTLTRAAGWGPWYGITEVNYAALFIVLLSGPLFAFGTTYAIVRHQVFNLRLIAAQLFIFALWTFIFFKALIADSLQDALPDILLLCATIVLGIFLIRSVLKEVAHKERLEKLSGELRSLNEHLEEKVDERTTALNRSKRHLESVVENLTVGLVEHTAEGEVLRLNKTAETLLGARRDVTEGKRRPGLKVALPPSLERVIKEPPSVGTTYELHIDTPKSLDLQIMAAEVPLEGGRGKGHVKIIRDITKEKAIERNKSEFISTAAHQLRTPLAAMRWTFELFLGGGAGRVSKAGRELLEQGKVASENMTRIVNDLLNAARIEEGRFEFRFTKGTLTTLIGGIRGTLETLAEAKGISLYFDGFEALPTFTFDEEKVGIVLQNLVDNALKYSPRGSTVRVRGKDAGAFITVSVTDEGIGIPKEDQQNLFTKFFRGRRATTMFTDGSGMGLFIVKGIIERHGGSVMVESTEGTGTTITVSFPKELPKKR